MSSPPPALPARNTDRLFLALLPEPDALARLAELGTTLRTQFRLSGKPIAAERLHVTLHFLGDHAGSPPQLVAAVNEVASAVAQRHGAFDVAFDRLGSFPGRGPRPLVLRSSAPAGALQELQRSLGEGLTHEGLAHTPSALFTPHLTLLYDLERVALQPLAPPVAWRAQAFVLVRSHIGRASHEVVGRWPLEPAG